MKKALEKLGLNQKEASVYLALLELGQTSISRIAQKSGVKRTSVYDVLKSLKTKGLVGRTISKGKTYYFAEDPGVLKEALEEKFTTLEKVMPQLLSITNFLDQKPKIRFYEGKGGIRDIYEETLELKNDTLKG
jgi:sugar-specific transcriptional regulator TrmB